MGFKGDKNVSKVVFILIYSKINQFVFNVIKHVLQGPGVYLSWDMVKNGSELIKQLVLPISTS